MNDLSSIQDELMDRLRLLIPRLQELNSRELIEVARGIDFVKEMDNLGLSGALESLYKSFDGEIEATIRRAAQLGIPGISTVNLESVELMRLLKFEELGKDYLKFASNLKTELFRGIISGTPAKDLSARLFESFGKDKILTSAQTRLLVRDSFSRLSDATRGEILKDADVLWTYIGPLDELTRDECVSVLSDPQNEIGYKFNELPLPIDIKGGWNCRHKFVVTESSAEVAQA
tara:strand:- start:28 stop:723 length:696 start_codon:yes stop_codon:yes gene_type:complete